MTEVCVPDLSVLKMSLGMRITTEDGMMTDTCPNCGDKVKHDVHDSKVKCGNCDYVLCLDCHN